MDNKVYTHDESSRIIELFEDILIENEIVIPSPEDEEKEVDNFAALYGSVYSNLMDNIEEILIDIINRVKNGGKVIENEFSGNY